MQNFEPFFVPTRKCQLPELPIYVSVDKDVLSKECASTNWDQGNLASGSMPVIQISIIRSMPGWQSCGSQEAVKTNK